MFYLAPRHQVLETTAMLVLVLSILLVGCSETPGASSGPSANPSTSPSHKSASCTQPQPAPGKLSLAGLAYGSAHTGQDPTRGVFPSSEEIEADMPTLASLTGYIRIYSATGPAEAIVQAAQAANLCVALGIDLSSDPAANAREMMAGVRLASNSTVHALIVGNEVLQNGVLSEQQLRSDIDQVRAQLGRAVPITVADTDTAWLQHPDLARDVDFITVHIYPFWQGVSIESALQSLDQAYTRLQKAFPGKQIVIGETGWPSAGPPYEAAIPSAANQARYVSEFINWAQAKHVQYFYFDAFDEDWKIHEMGVGTHWGLYQQNGELKPALNDIFPGPALATLTQRGFRDVYVNGLEADFVAGVDTSGHLHQWLTNDNNLLSLAYPAGQQWGGLFITVGPPVPLGQRPSLDLSAYKSLVVDLRPAVEGQCVHIGIKNNRQPDDGSEITVQRCLPAGWSTVTLPLSVFRGEDLAHLYVVFELLFQGVSGASLEVRNIRYSPS
jgi:exo-beta-1,3-glucanase (GH17 family)